MLNPLRLPPALLEAVLTLAEMTNRLPALAAQLDERAERVERDIAAMRRGVKEIGHVRRAVEPLDDRLERVERELGRVRDAVAPLESSLGGLEHQMSTMDGRLAETNRLQGLTNEGIDGLRKGVDPLAGSIESVRGNTAPLADRLSDLQESLTAMQAELAALRSAAEPVTNAAARVGELRDRLPGRG